MKNLLNLAGFGLSIDECLIYAMREAKAPAENEDKDQGDESKPIVYMTLEAANDAFENKTHKNVSTDSRNKTTVGVIRFKGGCWYIPTLTVTHINSGSV